MGDWSSDVETAMKRIAGPANYEEIYETVREVRLSQGRSWPSTAESVVRREIQEASSDSKSWKGLKDSFTSVNGLGKGIWAIRDSQQWTVSSEERDSVESHYQTGEEGIRSEAFFLKRSRNRRLVDAVRQRDCHTCCACSIRPTGARNVSVIEVHHLRPLYSAPEKGVQTTLDDLVCLCPTCHRIAHTGLGAPLSLEEIRVLIRQ